MRKALIVLAAAGVLGASVFMVHRVFSQPSRYEGKTIRKIEFVGLKNADKEDLYEVLVSDVGFPLKAAEVREDIKAVFKTGQFENVQVEIEEF
ncbi:MAG TPA: POTRA domain-containing protein, partial [Spirochaetota bacterium]|nr:POTRA domain-containing protein [Spirochaetota bacterium]